MSKDRLTDKFAVILHADVAGSTRLVQQDEHLAHERMQETFRRLGKVIDNYQGSVVELRGDALLAEFTRPSDAINAALAFQSAQQEYLQDIGDGIRPMVRVGISMGEVVIADKTVTGTGVIVAQRAEQLANPGGICITAAVHEALPKRLPIDYVDIGKKSLKGIDEPHRLYHVELSAGGTVPHPEDAHGRDTARNIRGIAVALVAVVAIAVAVSAYWLKLRGPATESAQTGPDAGQVFAKPSIAVLPFANFSDDREQEYFSDGLTEDLITDISKISGLDVIARNSTFSYKGQSPDVRAVGRDLGVSHVIEGSVRKAGNTVRITIQLVDAADGKHVWAERYDRELSDVFAIQDEVIGQIIAALSLNLTPEEAKRVVKRGTENLEAYDLFMRGRQQESYFNKAAFVEAQRYYEQAIDLDPDYAEAWARLAQIHAMNGQFGWVDDIVSANLRALALVEKSVALDADIPFIHYSYSRILARESIGRHEQAIAEARKAIELDPNYADAYAYIGQLYVLTGQAEKTIEPITTAMRINPNFPFWYYYTYGFAHFFMGNYDTAVENTEKAVERNPNVFFARTAYAASLAMAGRLDDAEWQIEELYGLGFNKSLEEFIAETPVHDPAYRALYREGLKKAGLP